MKFTKVESLQCPLCKSMSVTRIGEILISCSDCKQVTKYQPPTTSVVDVDEMSIKSQIGNAKAVFILFMVVPFTAAVYGINNLFSDDIREDVSTEVTEDIRDTPLKVGDCYMRENDNPVCIDGAPDWEQETNKVFISKIVEFGVKKVKTVWATYDCKLNLMSDYYHLDTEEIESLQYYKKVTCPNDIVDVKPED